MSNLLKLNSMVLVSGNNPEGDSYSFGQSKITNIWPIDGNIGFSIETRNGSGYYWPYIEKWEKETENVLIGYYSNAYGKLGNVRIEYVK